METNPQQTTSPSGAFSSETEQLRQQADRTREEVRRQATAAGEQFRSVGTEAFEAARLRAIEMADQQKLTGAQRTQCIATALERAADELGQELPELAQYTRQAASAVSDMAGTLRDKPVTDLLGEAQSLAYRYPAACTLAALTAGFVAARFLKSTTQVELDEPEPTLDSVPAAESATAAAAASMAPEEELIPEDIRRTETPDVTSVWTA